MLFIVILNKVYYRIFDTNNKIMITYDKLQKTLESKGYRFFTGDLNINLIGIRNSNELTNEFDDFLCVAIEENGKKTLYVFNDFTTDPGFYYLKKKFLNPKGCAIMKPGQYGGMLTFGKHRGKYDALVQVGKCTVYRDRTKDNKIDFDTEQTGVFGINIHHAYDREEINKYSAGCQVHQSQSKLDKVLELCEKSAKKYGDKFTYTLIELKDLCND